MSRRQAPANVLDFIFLRVHRTTDWQELYAEDYAIIGSNALEARAWFLCACFVLRRNLNEATPPGHVRCRRFLGWLLRHCYREAA